MNCADIDELAPLWHTGELETARREAFDAHVAACEGCAAEMREQRAVDERLRMAAAADAAGLSAAARDLEARVLRQIARERRGRWLLPAAAAAALAVAAALLLTVTHRNPADPVLFRDAARDHTVEVIQQAQRRWRTDPADVASLEASQGIPDAEVKAVEATGYRLQRAKICRLGGVPWMHLVYARDGREFSVYMRAPGNKPLPDDKTTSGALHLSSFARGHVQAVVVTDASRAECDQFTEQAERAL